MGWIKHEGNGRPVLAETVVWVKFRDGYIERGTADSWHECWRDQDMTADITHYSTDELCPDEHGVEVGGGMKITGIYTQESGMRPLTAETKAAVEAVVRNARVNQPGMSEREFVQRYVLRSASVCTRGSFTEHAKVAIEAYRAIDEAHDMHCYARTYAAARDERIRELERTADRLHGECAEHLRQIAELSRRLEAVRKHVGTAIATLGPNAPSCSGCEAEWNYALEDLRNARDLLDAALTKQEGV